ncbi:hypothetical protein ACWDV4_18350 [Micromonospora sp. NPDC003197]
MAKNEFRFVVDGVELDEVQKARIAGEIQKAGLDALHTVQARLDSPVTVGHGNIKLRPEWHGLWVLSGDRARDIGAKINDLGFFLE